MQYCYRNGNVIVKIIVAVAVTDATI